MPDDWSEFDDRWRAEDERKRRDRREQQRRRTRRTRIFAVVLVLLIGGGAAYAITSSDGGSDGPAPVSTVAGPGDTTADGKTVTTPPKPKPKPLTPLQKRVLAEDRTVEKFGKRSWFLTQGGKRKRMIALTFDDGPSEYTSQIMRILNDTDTPATFFQIGAQIPEYKHVVRQMLRDGFVLANHTENHMPLAGKPREVQNQQITSASDQLEKVTGFRPVLFRPPTGVWDRTTRQLLKKKKMVSVFWSIDTEDYQQPGTQRIVDEVVNGAKAGAVVLMHDGGGVREQTVAALPEIISGLKAKGFTLVTVPELLKVAPPKKKKPAPFGQGPGL